MRGGNDGSRERWVKGTMGRGQAFRLMSVRGGFDERREGGVAAVKQAVNGKTATHRPQAATSTRAVVLPGAKVENNVHDEDDVDEELPPKHACKRLGLEPEAHLRREPRTHDMASLKCPGRGVEPLPGVRAVK